MVCVAFSHRPIASATPNIIAVMAKILRSRSIYSSFIKKKINYCNSKLLNDESSNGIVVKSCENLIERIFREIFMTSHILKIALNK